MRLRHEIAQQKDEDKRAAINQLQKLKEEEIEAMKRSWEKKVEDLLSEVRAARAAADSYNVLVYVWTETGETCDVMMNHGPVIKHDVYMSICCVITLQFFVFVLLHRILDTTHHDVIFRFPV